MNATATLTLNPARTAALDQALDFFARKPIEVAGDRVLQARGGDGKLEGVLMRVRWRSPKIEAAGEAVAAAHAIDDVRDVVVAAEQEILAVVEAGATSRCARRCGIRAA